MSDLDLDLLDSSSEGCREVTRARVGEAYLMLVKLVAGSLHLLPKEILLYFRHTSKMIQDKFGKKGEENVSRVPLVGLFFIRFLCPALIFPGNFIHKFQK